MYDEDEGDDAEDGAEDEDLLILTPTRVSQ